MVAEGVNSSGASHEGRGFVLIMDDEAFIRETLGLMLASMGYTILEAKDGMEALKLATESLHHETPLAGAFFDLTIPGGMGGKEAIIELRKHFPQLPVFASSGYSEDPVMARPVEHGFTAGICKPYRKDELAALLNRHPCMKLTGKNNEPRGS